jgi:di/tricarboxylate transporter
MALARATQSTGLAGDAATWLADALRPFGARVLIGGLFLFSTLLTQVLSNNAAAALMTPLAYATGMAFDTVDPRPMPFVMAVAFGANCSFLTPVSYQTNLLVYGPGGYRFIDFLKPGVPLTALYTVVSVVLLPWLY